MANKRQREARKRFKEAHPEQFPNPEPTPPKDPNKKKKKKKSNFKRKRSDSDDVAEPNSKKFRTSTHKKHLLRVPGMKPGESCFICRDKDHIAKNCPQKATWERNKVCFIYSIFVEMSITNNMLNCIRVSSYILGFLISVLPHVCRYVCFVGDVATVSRTALTRMMNLWIRNCVIIVAKPGILWQSVPSHCRKVNQLLLNGT